MQPKMKGPLLIAATSLLWSTGGLLIKLIPWDAMTIIGLRAIFAGIIMALYMRRPRISFKPSVILGGLCMSGTTIFFVFANKLTTAANAIMLQYTAPIFVVILSALVFKKRIKALEIVSVLAVFAGIALFFLDQLRASGVLGNILACLAGVTFSGVFLINQMPDARPEESLLLGHIINAVIAVPFIVTNVTPNPTAWLAISLLGIFQLGIAYVLFSKGIKLTQALTASLIAVLEPLLNPVWVMLMTGETPGMWAIIGGVIVITVVVVYSVISARRNGRGKETELVESAAAHEPF